MVAVHARSLAKTGSSLAPLQVRLQSFAGLRRALAVASLSVIVAHLAEADVLAAPAEGGYC